MPLYWGGAMCFGRALVSRHKSLSLCGDSDDGDVEGVKGASGIEVPQLAPLTTPIRQKTRASKSLGVDKDLTKVW